MKEIKDYEGLYWIDENGHIYNRHGRCLKGCPDKDGYLRVLLYNKKKRKLCGIHRLVALHFIENPDNLPTVNHKNGDKNDNNYTNLEWMTSADNIKHGHQTGLFDINGVDNGQSKLTEKQVLEIREKYIPKTRGLVPSLAEKYGVNESIIYGIVKRKTWKHI